MRKPFSPDQHQQDDSPAKIVIARYLVEKWKVNVQEGEKYDADLVCIRDGEVVGFVEVERRHNWTGVFPFQTVHVPARKEKFFRLDKPTMLFSVRSDLQQAMWCSGKTILECPIKMLDNKHCENEDFFVVPLDLWKQIDL